MSVLNCMIRFTAAIVVALCFTASSQDGEIPPMVWQPVDMPGCGGGITAVSVNPHNSKHLLAAGDMMGIAYSMDQGETWKTATGLRSWEVADFTWHPKNPNIVWVGTMSGPYISMDGGKTWEERRVGMPSPSPYQYTVPIQKVLVDPNNTDRVLAFGGSKRGWTSPGNPLWGVVWQSTDAGRSWYKLTTITQEGSSPDVVQGVNIVNAVFAPGFSELLYVGARGGGVYETVDSGRTWTLRVKNLPSKEVESLVVHPTLCDVVWIAMSPFQDAGSNTCIPGGIYKTISGGLGWDPICEGLPQVRHASTSHSSGYAALGVSRSNPKVMYTCNSAWNAGVIYKSIDAGKTWHPIAAKPAIGEVQTEEIQSLRQVETCFPASLSSITNITVDPKSPDTVYVSGSEYIIRSTDGGKTWIDITAKKVGENSWAGRGICGLTCTTLKFDPQKAGHAILLARDAGKAWETTDGMKSWTFRGGTRFPWGGGNDATFAGPNVYISTGQFRTNGSIVRTVDGKVWEVLTGDQYGLPETKGRSMVTGIHALPSNPRRAWAVIDGLLFATFNGGDKWHIIHHRRDLGWIAADPRNPQRFYVTGRRNSYVTLDGRKFTPIGGPRSDGRAFCDSKGRLYIAAWGSQAPGLWRYSGKWERLLDDELISNIAVDPKDPSRIAAVTSDEPYHDICRASGVWLSDNNGKSWAIAAKGLPMTRGEAIAFDPHNPGMLYIGAHGRGLSKLLWPAGYKLPATKTYTMTKEDLQACTVLSDVKRHIPTLASINKPPTATDPAGTDTGLPSPLRNGGMEQGTIQPRFWTNKWVGNGKIMASRDTAVFKSGKASLRIATIGGRAKAQISQIMANGGIRTVELTAQIRTQGKCYAHVAVQSFDPKWKTLIYRPIGRTSGNTNWRRITGKVTIPNGSVRLVVGMLIEGTGKAWLDDVEIKVK